MQNTYSTSLTNLPLLVPGQANKTVTHNEALMTIDALMHLTVQMEANTVPNPLIEDGQCLLIGEVPTGLFEGHAGDIAQYLDGSWRFFTPKHGWRATNVQNSRQEVFNGQTWIGAHEQEDLQARRLGVGTVPDSSTVISAFGDASLFSGATDHRLKVNRSSATDTGAILFSTSHQGRAEIGLTGTDKLSIKMSADGTMWDTLVDIDPSAGVEIAANLSRDGHRVWDAGNAPGVLYDRGIITNNTDLNTLVARGVYTQTSNFGASTGTNYPRPLAGMLTVYDAQFGVQQTYRLYGGAPSNEGDAIFVRSLYGGTWRAWRKLLSEAA